MDADDLRKSKIRDTNKEFARRMTILQAWSDYWTDYTIREGDAYSKTEAKSIIRSRKKINCPICRKAFTTIGGLRYHYARCNIERCFKCKVCNPPSELKTRGDLLRHMIRLHYVELPTLNSEQKEIANSFLVSAGRNEKPKGRKATGDLETQNNAKTYVKCYGDLVSNSILTTNLNRRPFAEWPTTMSDWEIITSDLDRRRFRPPERESPRIKVAADNNWNVIRVGDSHVRKVNGDLIDSAIFYTGGISTSAAWAPKPYLAAQEPSEEYICIAVNNCTMDKSILYKDCKDVTGCIQFWSTAPTCRRSIKPNLEFMIGHNYGSIADMNWCPLGASYETPIEPKLTNTLPRLGLLALACGDGHVRIISVPHPKHLLPKFKSVNQRPTDILDSIPMFKVKPIATLMPPGAGCSTDCQPVVCTSLSWNVDDNQRLLAAGYSSGVVALFDLANYSPILFSTVDHRNIYQPYKMWLAHCLPVVGVSLLSDDIERTLVATGSRDRLLKIWNSEDLNSCITFDRAPVTRLVWDYRLRGVVTASETAFTSYHNRVSYRFPVPDGSVGITVSTHRATVWGLANSVITSALATSDEAGEVFITPTGRPCHKKTKSIFDTFSLFTMLPRPDESRLERRQVEPSYPSIITDGALESTITLIQDDSHQYNENTDPDNEVALDETNEDMQIEDDYTFAERPVANKPAKFLLPIDERAVETYEDFKRNYGLEFVEYDCKYPAGDQKLPEAWVRAGSAIDIYCDRPCDYPFSSIKHLSWSPNVDTFSYLLSISHIGVCRIDRVQVLENIFKGPLESMNEAIGKSNH